ncbi:MAG: hypothetical protein KDD25_07985, partial [Bdellovibrionales bacterium]|nr:hypothetical protein [Bdellovibrionales bacterium]
DSQAAADKTIEVIEKHNAQKRVIIGSQYTKVVDYIKSKRPDWHFCASPQQVFRLVLMSQMFIETFEPMNADGYFIPVEQDGIMVANSRLMSEWNRRKIPVLIWTINDESQARELMKNGANGVITDFPSKMKGVVFNSH